MTFRGTQTPLIYLISNNPNDNEFPFNSLEGNFLSSILGSFELLLKSRMASAINQDVNDIIDDIYNTKPKVIVNINPSKEITNAFINSHRDIEFIDSKIYEIQIKDLDLFYISYVGIDDKYLIPLKEKTKEEKRKAWLTKYTKNLYKAKNIIDGNFFNVYKEREILNAHSFEEFKSIYEERYADCYYLAYDIETNARPPLTIDSKIIGFSIGDNKSGVYVSVDSLDFHMSEDEENKIWDYLKNNIFDNPSKQLIIHNTMYERPYTLCCKNIEIPYEKAHDTLVMAKMLRDPGTSAGLKEQAQENLYYPDWETDLHNYIDIFDAVVERIGLGPQKFKPIRDFILSGNNIFDLLKDDSIINDIKDSDIRSSSFKMIQDFKDILEDYYSADETYALGKTLAETLAKCIKNGGKQDDIIPYNWIPDKILSKYGAIDSIATYHLKDHFFERMDNESTDKINLYKGYFTWLEHMYVAYIMERNGLNWNENVAAPDYTFLSKTATACLKEVLLSPLFEPYIFNACSDKYKALIFADYLPEIPQSQGYEVELNDKGGYIVKKDGKRTKASDIHNIVLANNMSKYLEVLKTLFYDDVKKTNDWEELKEFYNPMSNESNDIAFKILITDKLLLGAKALQLHILSESPSFEKEKETLCQYDKQILKIADCCCDIDYLKENFKDNWGSIRKQFFDGFCIRYNDKDLSKNKHIKNILNNDKLISIDTLDDEGIITIYDNLVVTGIDPDNKNTWSEDFKWLINYRIFKKTAKIISSYIDGKVGHKSIYIVDKKDFDNKDHIVKRKRPFDNNKLKDPDEAYLVCAKWNPNVAHTGRWTGAFHTVPASSQVKKYYDSRFKGGTMLMPDYAQAEVRSLAAIANDENMLELFRSGKDFHTETAKKIFRKEEVTPAERRFSKGATFSLLYGSSIKSFAESYCDGDESYAKMIFDGFFRAYPNVQKWVEARHDEVKKDGRVSLELSNRFIPIVPDPKKGKGLSAVLRQAQNFPIQAQTADLTGGVVFDLQTYLEKNHLLSCIVMYIHDSIEVDVSPFELINVTDAFRKLLIQSPLKRMGIPSKADITLGCSLGHEIEMKDMDIISNNECIISLSGYKDEIQETIDNWKLVYSLVEVSDEDYKDKLISLGDLFIKKKAYSPIIGTVRTKGSCKVHIKY